MVFLPEIARSGEGKGKLNYGIYVLNVRIANPLDCVLVLKNYGILC